MQSSAHDSLMLNSSSWHRFNLCAYLTGYGNGKLDNPRIHHWPCLIRHIRAERRKNLFSVRQIDKAGYFVLFGDNVVKILDRNDQIIATGVVENDLYPVDFCLNTNT